MTRHTLSTRLKDKRGTVTVMVALLMIMLIGFAAFAIDVGYMMVRRNELQNIADTAALAAAGELGDAYAALDYAAQQTYTPASGPLLATAQQVASNTGLSGVTIASADFKLGQWDPATHTFTTAAVAPHAVNVIARRDNVANGPFTTLLAGVLGMSSFNVSAIATAALSGVSNVPKGGLPIPVGIAKAWYLNKATFCDQPIMFYPTGTTTGCAGWNVYEETPASANELSKILGGLANQTYSSPTTTAGDTSYNFTGGTVASALFNPNKDNMIKLFDAMRVLNDGVLDADNDPNTWTTTVPVYDWSDCKNPTGTIKIIGFSTVVITSVIGPPTSTIMAKVLCDRVIDGPGGGEPFGTLGRIPNLVQ